MKLYYAPGACSLADHIALEEAGLAYELAKVDLKAKTVEGGGDFTAVNPRGYVPALELDDGAILTENIAVLTYIAERAGTLMPDEGIRRLRVLEALAFVSTELHKNFGPFFKPDATEADREKAKAALSQRFGQAADLMGEGDWLVGDQLSVADCYLFVMLTWAKGKVKLDLPAKLSTYYDRLKARPAFAKALKEEGLD